LPSHAAYMPTILSTATNTKKITKAPKKTPFSKPIKQMKKYISYDRPVYNNSHSKKHAIVICSLQVSLSHNALLPPAPKYASEAFFWFIKKE
jgi:hypothetical protein